MRGGENETVSGSPETAVVTGVTGAGGADDAVGALSSAGGSAGDRSVVGVGGSIDEGSGDFAFLLICVYNVSFLFC